MAKEDFHNRENIDRDKNAAQDWESHHETEKHYLEEAGGIGEVDVEIKNAHASGDGSHGRNDKRLVEDEDEEEKRVESSY